MKAPELILQVQPEDNAAAALAMVFSCYGIRVPLQDLIAKDLDSAEELVTTARSYGLQAQGYRKTLSELSNAPLPLIAHWQFRSFVVVTRITPKFVCICSPEEGELRLTRAEFEAGYTGVVLCFGTNSPNPRPRMDSAFKLLKPYRPVTLMLCITELITCGLILMLLIIYRAFAEAMELNSSFPIPFFCFLAALVTGIILVSIAIQQMLLRRCARGLAGTYARNTADWLNHESVSFLSAPIRYRLGLLGEGCGRIPGILARELGCILQQITGIFCILLFLLLDPLSAVGALVCDVIGVVLCLPLLRKVYAEQKQADRDRFCLLEQASADMSAQEELRLTGRSRKHFATWLSNARCASRISGTLLMKWICILAGTLSMVVAVYISQFLTIIAVYDISSLMYTLLLSGLAAVSLYSIAAFLTFRTERLCIQEELDRITPEESPEAASDMAVNTESLSLQDASIPYGNNEVLKGVTFSLQRGNILAVKLDNPEISAPLSRICSGLEKPLRGKLYLGHGTGDLSDDAFYANIDLLGSGLPVPRGTIRDNITAGHPELTDYAVVEAASDALLHQSVLLRKEDYDAPASSLSRGERVLLEFACAFARGTSFLVAENITWILDPDTVRSLLKSVRKRDVGMILITDDPLLLQQADSILTVEGSRISHLTQEEVYSGA